MSLSIVRGRHSLGSELRNALRPPSPAAVLAPDVAKEPAADPDTAHTVPGLAMAPRKGESAMTSNRNESAQRRDPAAAPDHSGSDLDLVARQFEPISLDELNDLAALQTRRDRKYVLDMVEAAQLVQWLRLTGDARVLEVCGQRANLYDSVYLDTRELACFRMAVQKNRHQFKVRMRSYVDSGISFLEVKTKSASGHTVKNRIPWEDGLCPIDGDGGMEFIHECLAASASDRRPARDESVQRLDMLPSLRTRYRRMTIHLPGPNIRLTLDQDLHWFAPNYSFTWRSDQVIVETKSAGHPSFADHHLWDMGHRPLPSSKYAAGIALVHPDLPRERWSRTISQYLRPEVRSIPASCDPILAH